MDEHGTPGVVLTLHSETVGRLTSYRGYHSTISRFPETHEKQWKCVSKDRVLSFWFGLVLSDIGNTTVVSVPGATRRVGRSLFPYPPSVPSSTGVPKNVKTDSRSASTHPRPIILSDNTLSVVPRSCRTLTGGRTGRRPGRGRTRRGRGTEIPSGRRRRGPVTGPGTRPGRVSPCVLDQMIMRRESFLSVRGHTSS